MIPFRLQIDVTLYISSKNRCPPSLLSNPGTTSDFILIRLEIRTPYISASHRTQPHRDFLADAISDSLRIVEETKDHLFRDLLVLRVPVLASRPFGRSRLSRAK
jgi:hypothetical protein